MPIHAGGGVARAWTASAAVAADEDAGAGEETAGDGEARAVGDDEREAEGDEAGQG
ncbi:MAG TPA: hypothetical protein VML96_06355 [Egibacteraceae bacterium]|nr:hypothetical protein [Egibacteraceae bacterium]